MDLKDMEFIVLEWITQGTSWTSYLCVANKERNVLVCNLHIPSREALKYDEIGIV